MTYTITFNVQTASYIILGTNTYSAADNPHTVTLDEVDYAELQTFASKSFVTFTPLQPQSSIVLNTASTAITATTTSVDLSVNDYKELSVDVNISALTGTTPTYTLSINRKGVDGIYYPIYTGTAQSTVGQITLSLGVGASTNVSFGNIIQVVETLGGTTPSVTRSMSIIGK